jgi:hypothetical protein
MTKTPPTLRPCVKLVSLSPEPIRIADIALCGQKLSGQERTLLGAIIAAKNFILGGDVFAVLPLESDRAWREQSETALMKNIVYGINRILKRQHVPVRVVIDDYYRQVAG